MELEILKATPHLYEALPMLELKSLWRDVEGGVRISAR